jgi:hypothetical protein
MYLLFETKEEALERSEQEGIARGLAYHKVGSGTRYISSPRETDALKWALPVAGYNLTEEEQSIAVEEVTLPEISTEDI